MRNLVPFVIVVAVGLGALAHAAPDVARPADFFLALTAPAGWGQAGPQQMPERLHGTFLAGWSKLTDTDRAIIYVVAIRRPGSFTLAQASNDFRGFLTERNVPFNQDSKMSLSGRSAVKFAFAASGNGQIIRALSPAATQGLSTYMEIIIVANPWADGKGVDLLHFVFAAPATEKDGVRPAYKSVINAAQIQGRFPGAAGAAAPEGGEDDGEDSDLVASGVVIPGQKPVFVPGPLMPAAEPQVQTGRGLPPGVTFLVAVEAGTEALWVTPQHEPTGWYVLVAPTRQTAYVLSADEYKAVARAVPGLLVVAQSDALQPSLNRWDKLWPAAAAPAAPPQQ